MLEEDSGPECQAPDGIHTEMRHYLDDSLASVGTAAAMQTLSICVGLSSPASLPVLVTTHARQRQGRSLDRAKKNLRKRVCHRSSAKLLISLLSSVEHGTNGCS